MHHQKMRFCVSARRTLAVRLPSSVMSKRVGSGAVRALSSAPIEEEKRSERDFIEFLKSQVAEFKEMLSAKEAQLSAKETQFKEMLIAKDTQLKEERDARDAWQEERLTLWQKRMVLERERMTALAALGKIDLRRVLESIFPAGSRDRKSIKAFVEGNGMLFERCLAEPKIRAEACDRKTKQVTAESIAIELRRIWDDLHSDAHLQLSVEEWKTCRPEQPVVLKVNGITQARVLLLYHLLDNCGYPVEAEGVIPQTSR